MCDEKRIIPVVFCADDNYIPFLAVTLTSLKKCRKNEKYNVNILCENMTKENEYILKSMETYFCDINIVPIINNKFGGGYKVVHISKAMYYRLMIPELLSQYDKVVYLDCDVIIKRSLIELFDLPLGDNWIAGVVDYPDIELKYYVEKKLNLNSDCYINTGVLIIDNIKLRNNSVVKKCLDILQKRKDLLYPDQDMLNIVCAKKIKLIDDKWNMQAFKKDANLLLKYNEKFLLSYQNPWIIHYSTHLKPWKWLSVNYCSEWFKYTNLKYYDNKEYFRREFANLPVYSCGILKRILKKFRVWIWSR